MTPVPPERPFEPYQPSDAEPWDQRRINHLLRRAALGTGHDQIGTLQKLTPAQAVDSLVDFDLAQDPFNDLLGQMEGFFNFQRIDEVQGWFFFRMLGSPHRAQERMALFWHNHFATSASKVEQARLLHNQIELFRQKGLGNFRELLLAVARDPAMLVWLDGQSNRKGHANENFGREVMELFTLGIGNYTEKDVQELARAFTGWSVQNEKAVFNAKQWDEGEKIIFNTPGKYDSESAVNLLLQQPAAATHLSTKLLRDFVHPTPLPEHIEHYADRLRAADWQIKPVLKEVFTSRMFYSDWAYRSRIKSPVELAVGGAIALGGKANTDFLNQSTTRMGQRVLFPPNVKGWDGNEAWINANTVLVRFNYGLSLAMQRQDAFAKAPDLEATLKARNVTTAEQVVAFFSDIFLDGVLSEDDRTRFVSFLNGAGAAPGKPVQPFVLNHDNYTKSVRDLMHVMMSAPEYQLA